MNKLTPEQIKTLEDAFASYPDDYERTPKYTTMEGIQEQLDELEDGVGSIFFISRVWKNEGFNAYSFTMERIILGTQDTEAEPNLQ